MNHRSAIAIALLLVTASALAPAAHAASRPLVLVFETTSGEGADKNVAAETTRAVRNYLRDTQRVEATAFDRESPTVLRAIMDKKLTADKVASYASQAERIEVARILGFQYAAGAEVAVKNVKVKAVGPSLLEVVPDGAAKPSDQTANEAPDGGAEPETKDDDGTQQVTVVEVKLWLARVAGGKNARWETARSSRVGGVSSVDLPNAVQSATSAAVIEVSREAFADLPAVAEPGPATGNETTAIGADELPAAGKPTAADYAARAEESTKGGNLALAIEQYKRAVNADPTDGAMRVRLAEAYARKQMYREAEDELSRAREAGAKPEVVTDAQTRIDGMKAGEGEAPAEPPRPGTRVSITASKPVTSAPAAAIARMVEGDKLWNSGKPDEAADAYKAAVKLNPNDWRAHERLAVVDASISLFGESRKALEELAKVQPDPPPSVVANRYEMLRGYFDKQFNALVRQYETTGADFERKMITRESYYNVVKGLAIRLESMANFLDAFVVPPLNKPAHLRRGLACGLMAQAAASLLDYLETNAAKSKTNAGIFAAQAKIEIQGAAKLDENKIIVEREPAEARPTAEQPLAGRPPAPEQPAYEEPPPPEPYPEPPPPM